MYDFKTVIKDGYEFYTCAKHDLEECDICQLSMTFLNEVNRKNHYKSIGIQERKNTKEMLKTKGCANHTCDKKSENVEKLLYCSFCMTVAYCSVNCQRYFSIYDSKITIRIIISFIIEIIGNYIRYHVRKQFIQEVLD